MTSSRVPHTPSALGKWLSAPFFTRCFSPCRNAQKLLLSTHALRFPALVPALSGLRIAYASDIHYGAFLSNARLASLAEQLNRLQADLILLGGDYGEDPARGLAFWQELPPLHARYGVFASLGNHDRYQTDTEVLTAAIRRFGATPLVNNAVTLTIGDARLAVCATDDMDHGTPDAAQTAAQASHADFVISIPHSPDALQAALAVKSPPFFQLALCGHTHGGQVRPLGLCLRTGSRISHRYGRRHLSGVIREQGATLLISNGVGTTGLPVRLGAPAQYHLITLCSE